MITTDPYRSPANNGEPTPDEDHAAILAAKIQASSLYATEYYEHVDDSKVWDSIVSMISHFGVDVAMAREKSAPVLLQLSRIIREIEKMQAEEFEDEEKDSGGE